MCFSSIENAAVSKIGFYSALATVDFGATDGNGKYTVSNHYGAYFLKFILFTPKNADEKHKLAKCIVQTCTTIVLIG